MAQHLDRRTFLRLAGVSAGAVALSATGFVRPARSEPLDPPFVHGVASGDPLSDRVILWTRVTPDPDAVPGSGRGGNVTVRYLVATDPDLRDVVRRGTVRTGPDRDHTVKVDVDGLEPATTYHYAFELGGQRSVVGRTRTAPEAGSTPPDLRFALVSCSNFEGGYFAGYRGIAERDDLDFVLHVGDYIYEYRVGYYGAGPEIGREHRPHTDVVTLDEYRQRYACYREDPDLRAIHAAHPFMLMWDDHEVADDNWKGGAYNHDEETQGPFEERFAAATQAYLEWLPIRENPEDPRRLYRRFELGQLATLHMIDSRSYRSEQVGTDEFDPGAADPRPDPAVDDPDRTMLGSEQKAWFKDGLSSSSATWQLIGNPQMITPVLFPPLPEDLSGPINDMVGVLPRQGAGWNKDQWDGYRAARQEILQHLADNGIDNTVFFTGDIHSSWACDVPLDPGGYPVTSPSVAAELVGTSVTSDNLDEITGSPPRTTSIAVEEAFKANNRHIQMIEFDSHGFSVVDVNDERVQMDWWYLRSDDTPDRPQHDPGAEAVHGQSWKVDVGTNEVSPASGPVGDRAGAAPSEPEDEATEQEDDGEPADDPEPTAEEETTTAVAGEPDASGPALPATGAAVTGLGAAAVAAAEGLRRLGRAEPSGTEGAEDVDAGPDVDV
jgi:alkaline phosphatase D